MKPKDKQVVIDAIRDSGAIMSTIAKRLGVEWHTAKRWCNSWEATKQALDDEEQKMLDLAESKLFSSIHSGNTQDAKWLLSTKGKHRGYSERHEYGVEHSGGVRIVDDIK